MEDITKAFELYSASGEKIPLQHGIPGKFRRDILPSSLGMHATHDDNTLLFQCHPSEDFVCWDSRYYNESSWTVQGIVNRPLLEFRIAARNHISATSDGVRMVDLLEKQYELSYASYANNKAHFVKNVHCHTLDFHVTKEFLDEYSSRYKQVGLFLDKVDHDQPASLGDPSLYLSPAMISHVRDILGYRGTPENASPYYDGAFQQLFTLAIDRLSPADSLKRSRFSKNEIERVRELGMQLVSTTEKLPPIKTLAQEAAMNRHRFQECFKEIFGKPAYAYRRSLIMEIAHERALDPGESILSIASSAGFSDPSNFTKAFTRYYGYSPHDLRKKDPR